jgi:predicted RecB family nuclease
MEPTIKTDIVIAYSQCPRKAYLLLFRLEDGKPHEYTLISEEQRRKNQERCTDHLKQIDTDVQPYLLGHLRNGKDVFINADIKAGRFEAQCDVFTKIAGRSRFGKYSYEPSICTSTYSVNKEQKLELSFVAFVLKALQHTAPSAGKIISMDGKLHNIKLSEHFKFLKPLLEHLSKWTTIESSKPPPIVMNKHCVLCQFNQPCLAQAVQDDNLSLLNGMTTRVMLKYHKKGIFTVNQLSYLYKPRRKTVNAKHRPATHQIELQALAIREKKFISKKHQSYIENQLSYF